MEPASILLFPSCTLSVLVPALMFAAEHTNLESLCEFSVGKYLGPQTLTIFLIIAHGNPSFTEGISRGGLAGTGISVRQCTSFTFLKIF